jgi:hypothetical protein
MRANPTGPSTLFVDGSGSLFEQRSAPATDEDRRA